MGSNYVEYGYELNIKVYVAFFKSEILSVEIFFLINKWFRKIVSNDILKIHTQLKNLIPSNNKQKNNFEQQNSLTAMKQNLKQRRYIL